MSIIVVYDSVFGNTARIAEAVADALRAAGEVKLLRIDEAAEWPLKGVDLIVLGSPTRGFRPTPAMSELTAVLRPAFPGQAAAVFDTRLALDDVHPAPLRWVIDAGGYAAKRMDEKLVENGFTLRGEPTGFFVGGTEGPLKPGELERARAWAATLIG